MTDTHDIALHDFRVFITEHFGLKSIRIADDALLADHLQQRAALHTQPSIAAYVGRLRAGVLPESEEDWWAHALTINETYFFRNERDWTALREELLPQAARRLHGDPLHVLSLGCASGEEPWSMAMLLAQSFPRMIDEQHPILAGDIDRVQLEVASAGGPYSARSIRLVSPADRERFLTGSDNRWYLREDLKKLVRFRHLNLQRMDALRGRSFDVIFCRNVLIYFEEHAVQTVLQSLVRMLTPGGSVILGHSEGMLADMAGLPLRIIDGCLTIPATHVQPGRARATSVPVEGPRLGGYVQEVQVHPSREAVPTWQSVEDMTLHAKVLLHGGQTDEAGRLLRLVLQRTMQSPEAHYLLGMLHMSTGRFAESLTSFEQVLRVDESHLMARLQMVVLLGRTGATARAHAQRMKLAALVDERSDDEVIDDEQGITIGFIKLVCASTSSLPAVS
jgi:chemotaxis protein methyltransferase CheR